MRAGRPSPGRPCPGGSRRRARPGARGPGRCRASRAACSRPAVADLVELALGAGADEQAILRPGEGEDQRLGPEDLAGDAVGVDPVDGVVARRDGLGRGRARRREAVRRPGPRRRLGRPGREIRSAGARSSRRADRAGRDPRGRPRARPRARENSRGTGSARTARRPRRPCRRRATPSGATGASGPPPGARRRRPSLAVAADPVDQALAVAAGVDVPSGPTATQSRWAALLSSRSDHLPSRARFQSWPSGRWPRRGCPAASAARSQMYWTLGSGRDAGCWGRSAR